MRVLSSHHYQPHHLRRLGDDDWRVVREQLQKERLPGKSIVLDLRAGCMPVPESKPTFPRSFGRDVLNAVTVLRAAEQSDPYVFLQSCSFPHDICRITKRSVARCTGMKDVELPVFLVAETECHSVEYTHERHRLPSATDTTFNFIEERDNTVVTDLYPALIIAFTNNDRFTNVKECHRRAQQVPTALLLEAVKHKRRVIITGHSLGGATAMLYTLAACEKPGVDMHYVKCITFGCPLSVDSSLFDSLRPRSELDGVFHHVVHPFDPVPKLITLHSNASIVAPAITHAATIVDSKSPSRNSIVQTIGDTFAMLFKSTLTEEKCSVQTVTDTLNDSLVHLFRNSTSVRNIKPALLNLSIGIAKLTIPSHYVPTGRFWACDSVTLDELSAGKTRAYFTVTEGDLSLSEIHKHTITSYHNDIVRLLVAIVCLLAESCVAVYSGVF